MPDPQDIIDEAKRSLEKAAETVDGFQGVEYHAAFEAANEALNKAYAEARDEANDDHVLLFPASPEALVDQLISQHDASVARIRMLSPIGTQLAGGGPFLGAALEPLSREMLVMIREQIAMQRSLEEANSSLEAYADMINTTVEIARRGGNRSKRPGLKAFVQRQASRYRPSWSRPFHPYDPTASNRWDWGAGPRQESGLP